MKLSKKETDNAIMIRKGCVGINCELCFYINTDDYNCSMGGFGYSYYIIKNKRLKENLEEILK
jgi:hypothetical protein